MTDERTIDQLLLSLKENTDALEHIYHRLRRELFSYAYSILQDTDAANDAVSETFLRLYHAVSRYRPKGQGRAYLYGICRRVSLEMCREKQRQQPTEALPEAPVSSDFDSRLDVQALLKMLDIEERQVIVLHYFHDMTFKEIARVTDTPEGTVKWRHTKALEKCRVTAVH